MVEKLIERRSETQRRQNIKSQGEVGFEIIEKTNDVIVVEGEFFDFDVFGLESNAERKKGMERQATPLENLTNLSAEEQEQCYALWLNFKEQAAKPLELTSFEKIKARYIPFPEDQKLTVENITAHLEPQLKNNVKAWGAKEDVFYFDDLRKIEPLAEKMYQAFYRAHKRTENQKTPSPLLSDLIAKQTEKITKRLQAFKPTKKDSYEEVQRHKSAIKSRKKSPNNLPIPEHA